MNLKPTVRPRASNVAADSTSIKNASPKPGACVHIPEDGLVELDLGNLKKPDPSRSIFGNNIAQIFGGKLAAPVRRHTVGRLPRPQLIDIGIGFVQAVEHILNQRDAVV